MTCGYRCGTTKRTEVTLQYRTQLTPHAVVSVFCVYTHSAIYRTIIEQSSSDIRGDVSEREY